MKVAQVGRRLAEHLLQRQPKECSELGVEPEVVEAACLAHDLGHPPFGHLGEIVLNRLVSEHGDLDGFEGNAQSFRILTKLAVRFQTTPGLDLTRATLAACIKYPWYHESKGSHSEKWGVYHSEREDFEFARANSAAETKTAEAEIMDWADDIAYSVHDLEDFHRARLLPWRYILGVDGKARLVGRASRDGAPDRTMRKLSSAYGRLASLVKGTVGDLLDQPYDGTADQRYAIRLLTSLLIGRYMDAMTLKVPDAAGSRCVEFDDEAHFEVLILKQLAREYIINTPALQAQQQGQSKILESLFRELFTKGSERFAPKRFMDALAKEPRPRAVADCISAMTEHEAIALYGRLSGSSSGAVWDAIVY